MTMMTLSHGITGFTSQEARHFVKGSFDCTITPSLQDIQAGIRHKNSLHVTTDGHEYKLMSKLMLRDVRHVRGLRSGMANTWFHSIQIRYSMDPERPSP